MLKKIFFIFIVCLNSFSFATDFDLETSTKLDKSQYTFDMESTGPCSCFPSSADLYKSKDGVLFGKYYFHHYVRECGGGYKSRWTCNITNIKPIQK